MQNRRAMRYTIPASKNFYPPRFLPYPFFSLCQSYKIEDSNLIDQLAHRRAEETLTSQINLQQYQFYLHVTISFLFGIFYLNGKNLVSDHFYLNVLTSSCYSLPRFTKRDFVIIVNHG